MPNRARHHRRAIQPIKSAPLPPAPGEPGSPEAEAMVDETEAKITHIAPPAPPPSPIGYVTVRIPIMPELAASETHRVHVDSHLKGANGAAMIRVLRALDAGNFRLKSDKHVGTYRDALIWLMEQVIAGETP